MSEYVAAIARMPHNEAEERVWLCVRTIENYCINNFDLHASPEENAKWYHRLTALRAFIASNIRDSDLHSDLTIILDQAEADIKYIIGQDN
jgi:hypothetical protein